MGDARSNPSLSQSSVTDGTLLSATAGLLRPGAIDYTDLEMLQVFMLFI
jgi:hypothetical protein